MMGWNRPSRHDESGAKTMRTVLPPSGSMDGAGNDIDGHAIATKIADRAVPPTEQRVA